jgi:hypothetical protein
VRQEHTLGFDLPIGISDVLHGNAAAVVLEVPVCVAVLLILVDVIQYVLEMAFAVLSAFA